MRKVYLLVVLCLVYSFSIGQLPTWTFETSVPTTAGPHSAEIGTGSALGFHTSGSTVYSNPAGNASTESFSSNFWAPNDYYQFQFASTGFQNISITWDQTSSNTGPRDFKVQYSTDGTVFTDATGTNSTYTLTNDNWTTSGSPNPASTRTLDLSSVTALNNISTVYIRLVCNSNTAVTGGAIATAGSGRIDNVIINGNVLTSNTISIDAVSSLTFNIDCFTDGTGTVNFSSVGTFNAGNDYTAQMSDATGSFAAYTVIGQLLNSTANSGVINISIPAGTPTGAGYLIRVVSNDPVVTSSNTSSAININLSGVCVSNATDYFRSQASGNWNATSTWESSSTGLPGTWINATLTPTSAANTIQIINGDSVAVTASIVIDQVQIWNNSIVNHTGGAITVEDGPGADIDIQSGGVLRFALGGTPPLYGAGSPTINVSTGGILRVSAGGLTGAGAGVNHSNIIYNHQSILDWAPVGVGSFSTTNVTFFPNVDAVTIPIFRCSNPSAMTVGAAGFTTFNGVFEAVNATVNWENAGIKTFRNGIRGTANVVAATAVNPSGQFVINGLTADLGVTGGITTPTTGISIGSASGTTVTVTASHTITGDISLASTNTFIELGANSLTVTGTIAGGGQNAYVRTNGSGILTLNSIAAAGGTKTFPLGVTSYNPLTIQNNDATQTTNFSARLENGISPAIAFPTYGIQRTWSIIATDIVTAADLTFQYASADAGINAAQPQPMEVLMNVGGTWNVITGQQNIAPGGADPAWTINTNLTGVPINTVLTPYALGIDGGYILPIDCIIACRSSRVNNDGLVSWDVSTCSEVLSFEVQRAVNGGAFVTVATITPGAALSNSYTDRALAAGTNLYRIKIKGNNGAVKFSNTVAIINDTKGVLITSLSPNPVTDQASVVVNAAKAGAVNFIITDMMGRPLRQWKASINEGSNALPVSVTGLANGVYHLSAKTAESATVVRFIKQ
jgi:hypothetical protein